MFDEVTRDILTIISILLTIGLGIHLFNLINYFFQEISHMSIFSLVISITTLFSIYLISMIYLLKKLTNNSYEYSKALEDLMHNQTSTNTKYQSVNSNALLDIIGTLELINDEKFEHKYNKELYKILKNYNNSLKNITNDTKKNTE